METLGGWVEALAGRRSLRRTLVTSVVAVLTGGIACEEQAFESESLNSSTQQLTAAELSTLSFEQSGQWEVITGTATLSQSTTHIDGTSSLSVAPGGNGYVQLRNVLPLQQDGQPFSVAGYDVWVESGQAWDTQLVINAPSAGIYSQYLGYRSLESTPRGRFERVEFAIPSWIQQALQSTNYTDLQFILSVNGMTGTTSFLLDRFTLGPSPACECNEAADSLGPACLACRFEVPAPVGVHPAELALSAYQSVALGANSTVFTTEFSGNPIEWAPIAQVGFNTSGLVSDPSPGGAFYAPSSESGPLYVHGRGFLSGPAFPLGGAEIHDSLWYNSQAPTIQSGASAPGPEQRSVLLDRTWHGYVSVPSPSQGNVAVGGGANLTLTPGQLYDTVTVLSSGAVTIVSGGNFPAAPTFMRRLIVEDGGTIHLDPSLILGEIYVTNTVTFAGTANVDASAFTIVAFGSSDSTIDGPGFKGTLIAPRAHVHVGEDAALEGAIFARRISLDAGAKLKHVPRFTDETTGFTSAIPFLETATTGEPEHVMNGVTDDYDQAEPVAAATRVNDFDYVLTVSYIDRTVDPANPKLLYFATNGGATCSVDADCPGSFCFGTVCGVPASVGDATQRAVLPGASLMGYSYSLDRGSSYKYGGRLAPPAGWSVLWGDPAITSNQSTGTVYLANLAGSSKLFPSSGVFKTPASISNILDGFCVARSADGGQSFPQIQCFKNGICDGTGAPCTGQASDCNGNGLLQCTGVFYDGSTVLQHNGDVYFSAINTTTNQHEVWRALGDTLDFAPLGDFMPFDGITQVRHPRLRAFDGKVYIEGIGVDGRVRVSSYDGQAWSAPVVVTNVAVIDPTFPTIPLRQANTFSFDVGLNANGDPEVRTLYLRRAGTCQGSGEFCMHAPSDCTAGTTGPCVLLPNGTPGSLILEASYCPVNNLQTSACQPFAISPQQGQLPGVTLDAGFPLLKYAPGSGEWRAVWLWQFERSPTDPLFGVDVATAALPDASGQASLLLLRFPLRPLVPCAYTVDNYWGDYNDLIWLGDAGGPLNAEDRFFAPYANSSKGCRFQGEFGSDVNVSGMVFHAKPSE